ncbi:MAG: bifunctional NADP-dependent methylenetetrahydromethanopterin dehydrogenase/methylenetetrahydrofolate dehydrogenase [Planctomycetes bacterium]|nr:bifunctional NADP-dependent methylenetetrahydromethanopterin dehydrogenase/methylenetetrahydrofolate dehydrogenase [Planctomycetota bacterium]
MRTILIQLDTDPLASTFDRVVAVDAGVDELFSYGGMTPETVVPLVHGAMFTRAPGELKHTAIFVGGSDVAAGEALFEAVQQAFFGPLRVSVLMDSNGSNTTAAAAVLLAGGHLALAGAEALVLGGTGPVGQRAAELLARQGANVRVGSRFATRAAATCEAIRRELPEARLQPVATAGDAGLNAACRGVQLIIAAGAAGAELLSAERRRAIATLQVAIDLNAVPPAGLAGIEPTDKAREREGAICYGAIGVGGTKMKIHRAAVQSLFEANDRVLETEAVYRIGEVLLGR